jgi:hypothetical protein
MGPDLIKSAAIENDCTFPLVSANSYLPLTSDKTEKNARQIDPDRLLFLFQT